MEEKLLQKMQAEIWTRLLQHVQNNHDEEFARAFVNGTLSAIAHHLVKTEGDIAALGVFTALADACIEPELEQRA